MPSNNQQNKIKFDTSYYTTIDGYCVSEDWKSKVAFSF